MREQLLEAVEGHDRRAAVLRLACGLQNRIILGRREGGREGGWVGGRGSLGEGKGAVAGYATATYRYGIGAIRLLG